MPPCRTNALPANATGLSPENGQVPEPGERPAGRASGSGVGLGGRHGVLAL